jgi:hypothetical protein
MMFVRGGAQGGLLQRAWAEIAGQRRVCAVLPVVMQHGSRYTAAVGGCSAACGRWKH